MGIISPLGEIIKGNAESSSDLYQAQVATNNAAIQKKNADAALIAGTAAESASRIKFGALGAEQTVGYAANTVDVGTGTPQRTSAQTQSIGNLDAMTLRYNAAREAYGYQTQATSDLAQAGLDKLSAHNAKVGGYINAFNSLIGSANSTASSFSKLAAAGG